MSSITNPNSQFFLPAQDPQHLQHLLSLPESEQNNLFRHVIHFFQYQDTWLFDDGIAFPLDHLSLHPACRIPSAARIDSLMQQFGSNSNPFANTVQSNNPSNFLIGIIDAQSLQQLLAVLRSIELDLNNHKQPGYIQLPSDAQLNNLNVQILCGGHRLSAAKQMIAKAGTTPESLASWPVRLLHPAVSKIPMSYLRHYAMDLNSHRSLPPDPAEFKLWFYQTMMESMKGLQYGPERLRRLGNACEVLKHHREGLKKQERQEIQKIHDKLVYILPCTVDSILRLLEYPSQAWRSGLTALQLLKLVEGRVTTPGEPLTEALVMHDLAAGISELEHYVFSEQNLGKQLHLRAKKRGPAMVDHLAILSKLQSAAKYLFAKEDAEWGLERLVFLSDPTNRQADILAPNMLFHPSLFLQNISKFWSPSPFQKKSSKDKLKEFCNDAESGQTKKNWISPAELKALRTVNMDYPFELSADDIGFSNNLIAAAFILLLDGLPAFNNIIGQTAATLLPSNGVGVI
ncbi:hypothetical protein CYLTODRAFT_494731 [Cylindrobasidium torrendii FP15055 ss-10]|uniref:Uncharacterized protein n=1 Tax=Cylindrobasidium torrendii FP15055 ss-10 TaxID=1314674 RepID=A0A0D7AVR9_9AGAR|nr:hypothetical protein CYLTODRAFT_494731 [Cylindrobasidium torrendii FP15055 ss-10]